MSRHIIRGGQATVALNVQKKKREQQPKTSGGALSPRRTGIWGMVVAAALVLGVAACAPEGPDPSDSAQSPRASERTSSGAEPSTEVLASFALEFLLHAVVPEGEQEALAGRYFIDAKFAPYAYFGLGRLAPSDDTRAWVEREDPLPRRTREELEGLGLTICGLGSETYIYCEEAVEAGERHLAFGLGELWQVSESRWIFDFGFLSVPPSGASIGGARIGIRSQEGSWLLTSAQTLWEEH
jgi:hypothetical protein